MASPMFKDPAHKRPGQSSQHGGIKIAAALSMLLFLVMAYSRIDIYLLLTWVGASAGLFILFMASPRQSMSLSNETPDHHFKPHSCKPSNTSDAALLDPMHPTELSQERQLLERIAQVSHDIRTPLNNVLGFSSLIKNSVQGCDCAGAQDSDRISEYLEHIESAAKQALQLVSRNIDASKPVSGEINRAMVSIDLIDAMDDIISSMAVNLGEKDLHIHFLSDRSMPTYVELPQEILGRVMINLITNAIKFTDSGSIIIRTKRIKALPESYNLMEFSVEDTGAGISKEKLVLLFQKWNQGEISPEQKALGSGLGLSICKDYVEALGGTICADSEVGKGSRFYFRVPVKVAGSISPTQTKALRSRPALVKAPKIVILDEDQSFLQAIAVKLHFVGLNAECISGSDWPEKLCADIIIIREGSCKTNADLASLMRQAGTSKIISIEPVRNKRAKDERHIVGVGRMLVVPYYSRRMHLNLCINEILNEQLITPANSSTGKVEDSVTNHLALRNLNILSVDDNESNQNLMRASLQDRDGAKIECAFDGKEAISAARAKHYDLILMDLMMPGMDGGQVSEVIRREGLNKETPIIGVTARSNYKDSHPLYAQHTNSVFLKPFKGDLSERILEVLNQERKFTI